MAEKARTKRAPKKAPKSGPAPAGHNSGNPSDAAYRKWLPKIATAKAALDKATEERRSINGQYRSTLKAAEKDGVNIDAVILARSLEQEDAARVGLLYRDVGRVLAFDKSELATQMDLFQTITVPDVAAARSAGLAAGKNAEPAENNPYTPGGEEFEAWAEGWAAGQEENQQALRSRSLN